MCDCLCALPAATAAGRALFAKTSDRPPDEPQELVWLPPRRDRGPVRATHVDVAPWPHETIGVLACRPTWLWGVEMGVNEAGVATGNATVYTTPDPRPAPPGLVGMDLVRLGLERAATAAAAVDVMTGLLERHGQGGSGHRDRERPYWSSFLVADPAEAWVVETSGTAWAAEPVERTRATSNRTTIPAFDAEHRHPRQPVAALVDPRLDAGRAALAAGPVTPAALRHHLRSHVGGVGGWTVCMHVPGVEATTAAVVAELPAGGVPRGWWLLGSPCTSVWVPLAVGPVGDPPPWAAFAGMGPDRPAALDVVEAGLLADGDAATAGPVPDPAWPDEAWRRLRPVLDRTSWDRSPGAAPGN